MTATQHKAGPPIARHDHLSAQDVLQEMQEQALHASLRDPTSGPISGPISGTITVPMPGQLASQAVSLPALLELHSNAFVEGAFYAILHRSVDPTGLSFYATRLATGERSKIEILGELRYSAEGRKVGVQIPGLFSRYVLLRSGRIPVIGRGISQLVRVMRWPRQLRRSQLELLTGMAMLRATNEALQGTVARLGREVERLTAEAVSRPVDTRLQDIEARLGTVTMESWAEPLIALGAQVYEQTQRLRLLESQADDIAAVAAVLRGLRAEHGWPEEDASDFAARLTAVSRDVVRRAVQADDMAQRNRAELLDQSRRLGLLFADVRKRLDQPFTPHDAERLEAADDHRLDPLYVAFEDRFRGNRPDIRERQRAHLPVLHEAHAGSRERPIVDVGAGRGEWLELLRDEGLHVVGVDLNHDMVELCVHLGLECVEADAIGYLRGLADNSLGAVTGFHIIEHLPFTTFVALLDESRRVLKPGGVILFETPNPANLLVASRLFYLDPTHRNPLPAEMTAMIAEARGFVQVSIHELHPMAARFAGRDEVLAAQLDGLFHGPQDYALIARKA